MPVRNEATYIAQMVSALLAQEYPAERFELIVADGMSTDGTRDVLAALELAHSRLIVIDNPDRIVSTGLNAALELSCGEIVIRIDGHALPAPDFIRENVALLQQHPEAWIVGGPIRNRATTTFGKAVAIAMSHPFGVGNAFHRYPDYEGYSDSTAFPALRRWVFDRVGTFDTRLVRNQDDEFNYRVTQAGGKIYISPRVRYSYFVRERMGQLFSQYFQYGFWRIPVIEKHRRPTTVRQLAPTLFYAVCAVLALGGLWWRQPVIAVGLPVSYLAALLAIGCASVRKHGVRVAARVPSAIATMHAGYGWGIAYGLWARLFRPTAWDIEGQMATISR
jgi:glycosyltransferase involved in cell wall biosynthesis